MIIQWCREVRCDWKILSVYMEFPHFYGIDQPECRIAAFEIDERGDWGGDAIGRRKRKVFTNSNEGATETGTGLLMRRDLRRNIRSRSQAVNWSGRHVPGLVPLSNSS